MRTFALLVLLAGCSGNVGESPLDLVEGGSAGEPSSAGSVSSAGSSSSGAAQGGSSAGSAVVAGSPSALAGAGGTGGDAVVAGAPAGGTAGAAAGGQANAGETQGGAATAGAAGSPEGGAVSIAGAPSEAGAGGEPPTACVCDSGPCCDGCNFRPPSHFCGEVARTSQCVGVSSPLQCGGTTRIERDMWNLFCNGDSSECTRWAAHKKYVSSPCESGASCFESGDEASCEACD